MTANRRGGSGRRSRRGKGGGSAAPRLTLTSVPTGRAAYADTRQWLLDCHGPVCAYCETTVAVRSITLDHVTPRRGQTAYDRRDNLVLCCKACNSAKQDKPLLAFLLGSRKRVIALYKYGRHLSHQLVEMVNDLLPVDERPPIPLPLHKRIVKRRQSAHEILGDLGDESPYAGDVDEESPYLDPAAHVRQGPAPRKKRSRRGGRGGRPKA